MGLNQTPRSVAPIYSCFHSVLILSCQTHRKINSSLVHCEPGVSQIFSLSGSKGRGENCEEGLYFQQEVGTRAKR